MNQLQWINTCFAKLKIEPNLLPAYQRFMLRETKQYSEREGLDSDKLLISLTEPDELDSWTYAELLEKMGEEYICYFASMDGHMDNYADAYATERMDDCYEERVSAAAYKAIGAQDQPWSAENPGYQDVLHACRAIGKDEDFAHYCARQLPEREWVFSCAYAATTRYQDHFNQSIAKGHSDVFAKAYADACNGFTEVEEVALNYAECLEKLLRAGRSLDEANWIAHKYAKEFLEGYVDDEEDLDFELDKDEALAKAESAYRFRGLTPELAKLPEIFLRICQRKYPTNHSKQWFDEIEALARSALAGNVKLEDIQRSSYMEYLEEECRREESEKPPRFDLMSEEEFKKHSAKSEDEQELWEAEAQFREDCREEDLDPTDPDERERYEEILDETRDSR